MSSCAAEYAPESTRTLQLSPEEHRRLLAQAFADVEAESAPSTVRVPATDVRMQRLVADTSTHLSMAQRLRRATGEDDAALVTIGICLTTAAATAVGYLAMVQ